MNKPKNRLFYIGILFLLFLSKSYLFQKLIKYEVTGKRASILLINSELKKEIDFNLDSTFTIAEIIALSNQITSKSLAFTSEKTSNNPNKAFELKKANCVGYAALFNSIGNYILEKQKLDSIYTFNHVVGKLKFISIELNNNSSFFKDHDFNEIKNLITGAKTYVDPSLYDYFRITTVSVN